MGGRDVNQDRVYPGGRFSSAISAEQGVSKQDLRLFIRKFLFLVCAGTMYPIWPQKRGTVSWIEPGPQFVAWQNFGPFFSFFAFLQLVYSSLCLFESLADLVRLLRALVVASEMDALEQISVCVVSPHSRLVACALAAVFS